jgi:hypothetical protein
LYGIHPIILVRKSPCTLYPTAAKSASNKTTGKIFGVISILEVGLS